MPDVRIYASEREDGLADQIQGSCSAKVIARADILHNPSVVSKTLIDQLINQLRSNNKIAAKELLDGVDQPDLTFLVSILVSTGWNLNDDIFAPGETFAAKDTPVHKPINIGHDDSRIVGHIVQSKVLSKDGTEIEDAESHPDFDIEVAGVLYSKLPACRNEVTKLANDAEDGEAYVSMECWFGDFAYGFRDPKTNVIKIVARQEDTAFLTKHLRAFGGTGKFEGYQLGRVLLGIVFGGMGIVENPANPDSIVKEVRRSSAKFENVEIDQITKGGVNSMAKEEEIQAQLDTVTQELEAKDKEIAKLTDEHDSVTTELQKANEKVESLTETLSAQDEEDKGKDARIAELEESVKAKDAEITKLQETVDETTTQLDNIRKDAKAKERLESLRAVKAVRDEEATLAELREMSDETFAIILKYAGNANEDDNAEVTDDPGKKDTEVPATSEGAEDTQETVEKTLDNVEATEDVDLQPGKETDDGVDTAKATARCLLGRTDE